jgi:hypothetical protein
MKTNELTDGKHVFIKNKKPLLKVFYIHFLLL